MGASYIILWAVGIAIIFLALRTKDEVYRLGAGVAAAIFLVWGFALTPPQLQFLFEAIALIAVFPTCIRCLKE